MPEFLTGRDPGDERDETPEVAGGEREGLDLAEITRRLGAADEVVSALCEGKQRWTMSIPADIERDPDIVIARALHDARRMLALLSARPAPEREDVPGYYYFADSPGVAIPWQKVAMMLREAGHDVMVQPGFRRSRPEPVSAPGAEPVGFPHVPDDVVRLYRDHAGFHYAINALAASSDPTQVLQLVCRMREQIPSFASPPSVRAGGRGEKLREALEQCAKWFDSYAQSHEAKGSHGKAERNRERAAFARRALAASPDSGDVQGAEALRPFVEFARMIHPDNDDADEIVVEKGMPVLNVGHFRALLAASPAPSGGETR